MKIKNKLVNGDVVEIKPYVFVVIIKDIYDRSMLFCRYQEYYTSPYSEIRGKFFTLESFMKFYIKNNKEKVFTYPYENLRCNIPSDSLIEARKTFSSSINTYDVIMNEIIDFCEKESAFRNYGNKHPWYLIGVDRLKTSTLNHRIAHGLYNTNLKYKVEMDYHTFKIPQKYLTILKNKLMKEGYINDEKILNDEIQAYMSTGKLPTWGESIYRKFSNDYIETFKRFNN